MENNTGNVILFPKWRSALENESLLALQEKRYEDALTKLDELLGYGIRNHEMIIGKLMCLMELNRYEEAQDYCEELLIHKDEHYYQYVHIYLTVLFQTSQYQLLMNQAESELAARTIPDDMKEQFQQLYDMSRKMLHDIRMEKSPEYINDLVKAVDEENHVAQYTAAEKIRKTDVAPTDQLKGMLTDERAHPTVKTAIVKWLEEKGVNQQVTIHKLGLKLTIIPKNIPQEALDQFMQQVLNVISDQEQENPALFKLMEQLLYRYTYVRYPIMPVEADIGNVAAALVKIGHDYLAIHHQETEEENGSMQQYIDEIKVCEALYSTVIET